MIKCIKYELNCLDVKYLEYYLSLLNDSDKYSYKEIEKNKIYKIVRFYYQTERSQILNDISKRATKLNISDENLINDVTDEIYSAEIAESIVQKSELTLFYFTSPDQNKLRIKITFFINLIEIFDQRIVDSIDFYAINIISGLLDDLNLNLSKLSRFVI